MLWLSLLVLMLLVAAAPALPLVIESWYAPTPNADHSDPHPDAP
jgi:hypothetical protein